MLVGNDMRALVRYLAMADRALEAIPRTEAALNAHPDFAPFHELHANALHAAGRPGEELEQVLTRALELDHESVAALTGLARLAGEADRLDEAIDLLDRAAAADREDPAPGWRAIQLLLSADRKEQIDARLDDVLMRDPIHAGALNLRVSRLLAQGGDLAAVEIAALRAGRFGGGSEAIMAVGLAALERGEAARAVRSLRHAAQLQPRSPTTQYALARALEASGNSAGAIAALRRALAGAEFPEADDAREQLTRLTAETQGNARSEGDGDA